MIMIYKVVNNPNYDNVTKLFARYKVELPDDFLKGNEVYVSLFINENIDDIVVGRTFTTNSNSKMNRTQNESVFIQGGGFKC